MRRRIVSLLILIGLGGCAAQAPLAPSATSTAATAAARSLAAQQAAREAQQKLAAVAAQRKLAEGQFCTSWRRALDLARRDAIGCARMEAGEQPACWQALSQWAGEEGRYFSALKTLFAEGPYAVVAQQAAEFFDLTRSWAVGCGDSLSTCASASERTAMDARKEDVNRFCDGGRP